MNEQRRSSHRVTRFTADLGGQFGDTHLLNNATIDNQRGLIYGMQIKMNANTMKVNGMIVRLKPGMAMTAEVQTGHKRMIIFGHPPFVFSQPGSLVVIGQFGNLETPIY